jgi:hypothetical protein
MSSIIRGTDFEFDMGQLHAGQADAYWALQPHRFKVLRCGRRFGKTELAKIWIIQALLQGFECAWLAPQHMIWSEVYTDLAIILRPLLDTSSKTGGGFRAIAPGTVTYRSVLLIILFLVSRPNRS